MCWEAFFPVIEQIMASDAFTGSQNYIQMMILIAKIFYMSIQVGIAYDLSQIFDSLMALECISHCSAH